MAKDTPKWRRRKAARPAEIIDAALQVFADCGFAAAKLDDIARRAGVAKGSLYLYFETKEDLFRAVVRAAVAPNVEDIKAVAQAFDGPFDQLVPILLMRAATFMADSRLPAVARMVIGESRNFPDLARVWHDDVVAPVVGTLAQLVARAQARGEAGPGDPRLQAFSLLGPLIMAVLFRDVFAGITRDPPNLLALAEQHARTMLDGLLVKTIGTTVQRRKS